MLKGDTRQSNHTIYSSEHVEIVEVINTELHHIVISYQQAVDELEYSYIQEPTIPGYEQ
jgi:hypothetical protein